MASEKSSNDQYWLKSGIINVMQNFTSVLFGFGGFYLMVRMLDKHSFGVWTLFVATTTIFEMVRSGLIQNALIKYLSFSESSEHNKILSASFALCGGLTLLCILINLVIAHYLGQIWKSEEIVPLFMLYSVVYLFSGILSQFHWMEQANFRFNGIFVTNFVKQGVFFIYLVICFFFKIKINLIELVYIQALALLLSIMVEYFFVKDLLNFAFQVTTEWVKKLLNYGKYAFGTSIGSILSSTIDQMMLGSLLSPAASGAFNIAVRIMNLVDIPTNAIAVIVFPQSARRLATDGEAAIKYLYEKSVGTILAVLIPALLFLFLFPDFVVSFIAGDKYEETVPILKVTVLYCLLIPFGRQCGTILDSIGRPKINFMLVMLNAVINLGLNYILISRIGVMGAAYATLISNIVSFTIAQTILNRILKVNTLNTFIYAYRFYPEFFMKYIKPRLT
ncbi:flippase [Dyadobacter arcticus]|uniref:O-antigen/teichoic acid export membrane protein n=1 Tax=Dyadobacter arcticus TaxID=1078754 RepID=A0ABX0UL15_9BACT|nr:flippase [Dyadobacter arcticus]NIJ53651.1 O-antigen/teichoic acid export membrane protein [Dyadobacter arcticus]